MSTELNPTTGLVVDLFGPTVEFLTDPREAQKNLCILKGVIPPGVAIPLHSHLDSEDFLVISGEIQALKQETQSYEWIVGKVGDYIHVPGGAPHAFRNVSSEPMMACIITTAKIGRFFQEVGRPATGAP